MVAAPETTPQAPVQQVSDKLAFVQGDNTFTSTVNGEGVVANGLENGIAGENGLGLKDAVAGMEGSTSGSPTATIPPPEIARNIPCRYFPQGTCKYGDQCAFSHGPVTSASPALAQRQQQHGGGAQQQQMHIQQMQQQPEEYQQVDQNGMPLYYAPQQGMMMEQANGNGGQYGQQFSPQQGYYPYPVPFQHYSQHYPPPPPHQQQQQHYFQSPPTGPVASPSANPVEPLLTVVGGAGLTSPSSPNGATAQPLPQNPYAPYQPQTQAPQHQQQQNYHHSLSPEFVSGLPSPSLPVPSPSSSTAVPTSLHTFFQTGAPPPPPQSGSSVPSATTAPFVLNSSGLPPAVVPSVVPRPTNPSILGPRRTFPPNGALRATNNFYQNGSTFHRPPRPCSFFEANRCRHGDDCDFVHVLPDMTDARTLGLKMIGQDGRVDRPQPTGGNPPLAYKYAGAGTRPSLGGGMNVPHPNAMNGAGRNGGGYLGTKPEFSRLPRHAQQHPSMNHQQQLPQDAYAQQLAATTANANVGAAEADLHRMSLLDPAVVGIQGAGASYIPGEGSARALLSAGAGAPGLVAAINGLTRRIPPVATPSTSNATPSAPIATAPTPSVAPIATTAATAASQRIPSGADFPALSSAPLSPSSTSEPTFPSPAAAPLPTGPTIAEIVSTAASVPVLAPVAPHATAPVVPVVKSTPAAPSPPSETSDSDFVMVSHAEASPPVVLSTPTPAVVSPVIPKPKVVMSFASAAARGASVIPVVPERVAKKTVAPVVVAVSEEENVAPVVVKEGKKSKKVNKERREREANSNANGAGVKGIQQAQVAVVA